jgi:transcriptional regulator with XRE-family HTH domain
MAGGLRRCVLGRCCSRAQARRVAAVGWRGRASMGFAPFAGVRMNADLSLAVESFPATLRAHRRRVGRSQLQTALVAGISQRHLSFLESGRARPGRGVVLALSAALGLDVARQNQLLLAAGFAPEYDGAARPQAEVELVERAMRAFLAAHEPFPALLLRDGAWIEQGNRGAVRLWSAVRGEPLTEVPRDNVFELMLRPGARRERLENWSEAAACLLRRYLAEHVQLRSPELDLLVAKLAANPEVRPLLQNDAGAQAAPVVLLRYRFDDVRLALFVVIASLHAPLDTRVERLRVEFLVPADAETERWFRSAQ